MAVATLAVIFVLIEFSLAISLVPYVGTYWGLNAAAIVSIFVSALAVGLVFAGKMEDESRIIVIGKIAILSGALMLFAVMISVSANGFYDAWVKEGLQSMFSTSAWTPTDWYVYGQMALIGLVAQNVVLTVVLGFIGLYAGSALRRPKERPK
jgi:hypothetical protein